MEISATGDTNSMRYLGFAAAIAVCLAVTATAGAMTVNLNADTAPNTYGSPNFIPWRTAAFADVVAGTFVNMRNGTFPGTTTFAPQDAIVYSTGDLGKRLHWIYWIPGETVASITGNFQVKNVADWDGVAYAGGSVEDGPEIGWATPSSWINYTDPSSGQVLGVIGTFGNAWWATGTPEAIQAQAADMYQYQTYWIGEVRWRDTSGSSWTVQEMELQLVPEPITMAGLMLGIGGLATYVRKRRTA